MRHAVIDLGTNTFHLLIAEATGSAGFRELYRERRFVKLAEAGIERIGPAPFARGIDTLRAYAAKIAEYEVTTVRAVGTAALRTAENGADFVREAEATAGIRIELIPGREEARLISLGVLQAIPPTEARFLIMDIGGGSVEFILAGPGGVVWAESFPVGVAVLYRRFHRSEPITAAEIAELRAFLTAQLAPLAGQLATAPTHQLVGAAGTFDVIADLLGDGRPTPNSTRIRLERFRELYVPLLRATREERLATPGIPPERADMIVVALILVEHILELMAARELLVSRYSMKEGIMAELVAERAS
jgi:exopolyphosphatase/guanosine-5'-triphosphate,3'-diphosphate pyrophosphatase